MRCRAFTLLEILIVIAIIAVLLAVLVPTIAHARQSARIAGCISNFRALGTAHGLYTNAHNGRMIDASHGRPDQPTWIEQLRDDFGGEIDIRSPVDTSPHFSIEDGGEGRPVDGTADVFRRTSYAINNLLAPSSRSGYSDMDRVKRPAETVHFVLKVFEGRRAAGDHVHPRTWGVSDADLRPLIAAGEMQTDAHGGDPDGWASRSGYGFLDGHAATFAFEDVYTSFHQNLFDPANQ